MKLWQICNHPWNSWRGKLFWDRLPTTSLAFRRQQPQSRKGILLVVSGQDWPLMCLLGLAPGQLFSSVLAKLNRPLHLNYLTSAGGDCPYWLRGLQGSGASHCQELWRDQGMGSSLPTSCNPSAIWFTRGHDVWYSEWEARVPSLGGPSQRNDSCSPHVCGGPQWHGARRVMWALGRGSSSPSPSLDRGLNGDHNSVSPRRMTISSISSHSNQSVWTNGSGCAGRRPHVKINFLSSRTSNQRMQWPITPGNWMWPFKEIRMQRLSSLTARVLISTGLSQGIGSKFGQRCYLAGGTVDAGWTLQSEDDIQCSEQETVHALSRLSRGHVWVWCMACTACPYHPNWVSWMHKRWASGRSETWPFLWRPQGGIPGNVGSQDGRCVSGYLCQIAQSCEADWDMIPGQTSCITTFSVRWIEQCVGHCIH